MRKHNMNHTAYKLPRLFFTIASALAIVLAIILACIPPVGSYAILLANRVSTRQKVIMLTFDDGPFAYGSKPKDGFPPQDWGYDTVKDNDLTIDDGILDILEAKGKEYYGHTIPGTFFEVGSHIDEREKNPKLTQTMKRIINSGSWIGSHTYSHSSYSKDPEAGIEDIKKSYVTITKFYKEYFTQREETNLSIPLANDVTPSQKSIYNLNISTEEKIQQINIPLRLGYLQTYSGMDDIKKELNIEEMIYGYLGTDWDQTHNAKDEEIQRYFSDNSLGNYKALKKTYGISGTDTSPEAKKFYWDEWNAKKAISVKKILAYEEAHVTKGSILVCHTRTFAKYWLPQLIDYCHNKGYSFIGMNPYYENTYYKNFGNLAN